MISIRWLLKLVLLLVLASTVPYSSLAQNSIKGEREYAVKAAVASTSLLLDGVALRERVVVVGERGHILTSDDGGDSWHQARVPTRATLTALSFHDDKLGWAVGHDAVILKTEDGGETWRRIDSGLNIEDSFLDVWFADAENGFAIGAYGLFLGTDDGGETWTSRSINKEDEGLNADELFAAESDFHLNHITRSASGRLYIAAEAGHIYRSDDEGESWVSLPSPYHGSLFSTLALDGDTVLVLGLRGHLYRSENAGETWTRIQIPTKAMLTSGLRLNDGTILVSGLSGTLLASTDGGKQFFLQSRADRQALATVIQNSADEIFLIGESGVSKVSRSEFLNTPTELSTL